MNVCMNVCSSFEIFALGVSRLPLSVLLGNLLVSFIQELSVEYNKYLIGERIASTEHECFCVSKLPPGQCDTCRSRSTEIVYK